MDREFFILNYIQKNFRSPVLDLIMPFISFLGKAGIIWICIAVICLCIKKERKLGIMLAADMIFNLVAAVIIIKIIVARERPCVLDETTQLITKLPFDYSFPSGHTLFAFGAATIIFRYHKKLGLLAFAFAMLMGFSRLYLFVHFPTDVLFGAIFGVLFAITVCMLEKTIRSGKGSVPDDKISLDDNEGSDGM